LFIVDQYPDRALGSFPGASFIGKSLQDRELKSKKSKFKKRREFISSRRGGTKKTQRRKGNLPFASLRERDSPFLNFDFLLLN
jgi:hypothetical protein